MENITERGRDQRSGESCGPDTAVKLLRTNNLKGTKNPCMMTNQNVGIRGKGVRRFQLGRYFELVTCPAEKGAQLECRGRRLSAEHEG